MTDAKYIMAPCVICGESTVLACSDCAIDSAGEKSVHVCAKTICRDQHEASSHKPETQPKLARETPGYSLMTDADNARTDERHAARLRRIAGVLRDIGHTARNLNGVQYHELIQAAELLEGYAAEPLYRAQPALLGRCEIDAAYETLPAPSADRAAVIEECAKVLDEAAQDWRRIRDPGMANNAASYAKRIRAIASVREDGTERKEAGNAISSD